MANRLRGRCGYPADDPFRVTFHEDRMTEPLRWKKPRRIAVSLMGDLFHESVRFDWLERIWQVMFAASQHTYLILTKRPERMASDWRNLESLGRGVAAWSGPPSTHILAGTSVENQKIADERIPWLLKCPAKVHFLSMEPLLGPVDLSELSDMEGDAGVYVKPLDLLNLVIVGGESGPGARPMHPDWARSIRDQCQEARVPFFFKQMARKEAIPDDLLIREWPQ